MFSKVVTEGATAIDAYFPKSRWYDYYDGREITQGIFKTHSY